MSNNGNSRTIENVGFLAAVLIAVLYGLAEAASRVGVSLGECGHSHGIPWGLAIISGALVLPKTVGRATAGRIWEAFTRKGQ